MATGRYEICSLTVPIQWLVGKYFRQPHKSHNHTSAPTECAPYFSKNIESFFLLSLQPSNHCPLTICSRYNSDWCNMGQMKLLYLPPAYQIWIPPLPWQLSLNNLSLNGNLSPLVTNSSHLFEVYSVLVTKLVLRMNIVPKEITVHQGKEVMKN